MQLKYLMTVLEAQHQIHRITSLVWSPNNAKLAVATPDRVVLLFDEHGERKDKFTTKPSDPAAGKASYVIRGLAFSPDSTRLAVAQSDNIVFVYKLGESWNEKKVICNKFPQSSSVASLIWLTNGTLIAGLEDGKVKGLNCKTNKSQSLYAMESSVVALAGHPKDAGAFLSSHDDGSIVRYMFTSSDGEAEQTGRIIQCSGPAIALAWTLHGICVTGIDKKVSFYDNQVWIPIEANRVPSYYYQTPSRVNLSEPLTTLGTMSNANSRSPRAARTVKLWPLAASIASESTPGSHDKVTGPRVL